VPCSATERHLIGHGEHGGRTPTGIEQRGHRILAGVDPEVARHRQRRVQPDTRRGQFLLETALPIPGDVRVHRVIVHSDDADATMAQRDEVARRGPADFGVVDADGRMAGDRAADGRE
jgi:hypothetical protein